MANPQTATPQYNQASFVGGMNLLGDDTRLASNQYRIGFNLTNRHDQLEPILQSVQDIRVPQGIIQELVTFGNYLICFVSGKAYYRLYTDVNWIQIETFGMSATAPRFWTIAVPVATTNYIRFAATVATALGTGPNSLGVIQSAIAAGAVAGNLPGLLVQDNINQPQFIFLDDSDTPTSRTTQTFQQWSIQFTDATNTVVEQAHSGVYLDNREYVPIGNAMGYDGVTLYIISQDGNFIYRSVSGRPLDFVVNVTNTLVTDAPYIMYGGGDATTTSYSVGTGPITAIRPMSSGGMFVAASNANFNVSKNMTPNAPTIFGEYSFTRTFLFNANCLSDRAIFDTTGDTRFIDLTGVRSFNAVESTQNEGRNSVFTATLQAAFTGITQDPNNVAGILYDNYELYAVQTIFGPAIAKYDTINNCWTSFDVGQAGSKRIKILSKIELAAQSLWAVTEDNKLYNLYGGTVNAQAVVRSVGICSAPFDVNLESNMAWQKLPAPRNELQLKKTRVVMNYVEENVDLQFTPYVNNRIAAPTATKTIEYLAPSASEQSNNFYDLPDVNTQLANVLFSNLKCQQGWKLFGVFSWSSGVITQYSMEFTIMHPQNPLASQYSDSPLVPS